MHVYLEDDTDDMQTARKAAMMEHWQHLLQVDDGCKYRYPETLETSLYQPELNMFMNQSIKEFYQYNGL